MDSMPEKARHTLELAAIHLKDGFSNQRFADLYQKWCSQTNYKELDTDKFKLYVKVYGKPKLEDKVFYGKAPSRRNFVIHNRMLDMNSLGTMTIRKREDKHPTTQFIEKHREEMMRRMARNVYGTKQGT
tara:strand:- start:1447 stop:1833 length:387 start_codon:yes stop_codon:yes gene_type:complete